MAFAVSALVKAQSSSGPPIARSKAALSISRLALFVGLHRELARQSANGTYFLSCRDAAQAHPNLNKDSANTINRVLDRLSVIKLLRVGNARLGGNASEFRYLLPL